MIIHDEKNCVIDYDSSKEMATSLWGSDFWNIMHIISFNYPVNPTDKDRIRYYKFFKYIQYVLPCKLCRDHLREHYKHTLILEDVFKNRNTLSEYVYKLHELVNKSLNKKSGLSYSDVKKKYSYYRIR